MSSKLYIDTNCIKNNINYIKSKLSKNTNIIAMAKANGYGCSAIKISKFLESLGISDFGVALVKEGSILRKAGINGNIIVTSQFLVEDLKDIIDNDLTVSISDIKMAELLNEYAKKEAKKVTVHIKIDSGMGRLGFDETNVYDSIKYIDSNLKYIKMQGIYTHLSCADTDEDYTYYQLQKFDTIITNLKNQNYFFKYIHALNSAGIINFPNYQYTHVRAGILIYGLAPNTCLYDKNIKCCLTLKSNVIRIHEIKEDCKISYGGTYIAKKGQKIATLQIGYADGLPRFCSNKYFVYVNGQKCKIVGNICMDMCMIDISNINENINIGDEVTIFKSEKDIQEIADINNTINYEIISRLGERIERIFI